MSAEAAVAGSGKSSGSQDVLRVGGESRSGSSKISYAFNAVPIVLHQPDRLRPAGLTFSDKVLEQVLCALSCQEGRPAEGVVRTFAQLAEYAGMSVRTVSRSVQRLLAGGTIEADTVQVRSRGARSLWKRPLHRFRLPSMASGEQSFADTVSCHDVAPSYRSTLIDQDPPHHSTHELKRARAERAGDDEGEVAPMIRTREREQAQPAVAAPPPLPARSEEPAAERELEEVPGAPAAGGGLLRRELLGLGIWPSALDEIFAVRLPEEVRQGLADLAAQDNVLNPAAWLRSHLTKHWDEVQAQRRASAASERLSEAEEALQRERVPSAVAAAAEREAQLEQRRQREAEADRADKERLARETRLEVERVLGHLSELERAQLRARVVASLRGRPKPEGFILGLMMSLAEQERCQR